MVSEQLIIIEAAMPINESVPNSLKISNKSPFAAEAEISLIIDRGSSSSGKFSIPVRLINQPILPHKKSRSPEARSTFVPTNSPISVGRSFAAVCMPSAAPLVKSSNTFRFAARPCITIYAAVKGITISEKYKRKLMGFYKKRVCKLYVQFTANIQYFI